MAQQSKKNILAGGDYAWYHLLAFSCLASGLRRMQPGCTCLISRFNNLLKMFERFTAQLGLPTWRSGGHR